MASRKTVMLVVAAVVSAAVVLLVGLANLFTISDASMCGNEIVHQETSVDGKMTAVVFVRNCGATTDNSTQVRLLPADTALPNESGNVFVAYVDPGLVHLSWTGAASLAVSHPKLPRESVFLQEPKVEGISISYATRE
jgi:hypothetical protein